MRRTGPKGPGQRANNVIPLRPAMHRSGARGSRYRDPGELRDAVLEQCAGEFRKRWSHLEPDAVESFFEMFAAEVAWDRKAKKALAAMRDALVTYERLYPGSPERDRPLGPYARMVKELQTVIHCFDQDIVFAWACETMGTERARAYMEENNLVSVTEIDLLTDAGLTRRQAVALVFHFEAVSHGAVGSQMPTVRELAVANLLAGEELPRPGSRGLTVFEVINKETKAMREVVRALRPRMERMSRELSTLGTMTERVRRPLS
jgi:hypothetical protein